MWKKTYSEKVSGVTAEQVWRVWADVDRWHTWQSDTEYAKLAGPFEAGTYFLLKPKGGPRVTIDLVDVRPNEGFKDQTRFPLAKMVGEHEFIRHDDGLEIKTTVSVRGPLSFVWRKIVAEGVAAGLKDQTRELVERARGLGLEEHALPS